jgi:hypothetical protein
MGIHHSGLASSTFSGRSLNPRLPQLTAFPTTTSRPPHRSTVDVTAAAIVSGSFRSMGTTYAVPPAASISAATVSAASLREL